MTVFPAGSLEEVLAGDGAPKGEVHAFIRLSHSVYSRDGVSYVAIGVLDDKVWLLAGADAEKIANVLQESGSTDAEIIELRNLH